MARHQNGSAGGRVSDPRAESAFESIARVAFRDRGLPPPNLQVWVGGNEGMIGRVDFLWSDHWTIAEADGAAKYADPDLARKQLRRDTELRRGGYEVVHFTWGELASDPAQVVQSIRVAFVRAARLRGRGKPAARELRAVPAVAWTEGGKRLGVTGRGADEILCPLGRVRISRLGRDARAGFVEVKLGDPEFDSRAEQRPARAGAAVRHADATGIDHDPPISQPHEGHVRVPAHHAPDRSVEAPEDLRPPAQSRVDDHDLLVVPWSRMAERDLAEPVYLQGHCQRQPGQQVDLVGAQLFGRPRRDWVRILRPSPAPELDQLSVGVAADPNSALPKPAQHVERLDWLRPGGEIAGQHHPVCRRDFGLGEHCFDGGQHAVYVG